MKRSAILSVALLAALFAQACSKEAPPAAAPAPAPAAQAAAKAPSAEARTLPIPILPGYKYYVGGPVLSRDVYGRYRISSFNGEVQQPPSRGMIFGVKRDGDQIEYRVWGNGTPLGFHKGVMKDGVYWEDYSEGYRMGKLVAREKTTHDDAARQSKIVTEDLDPQTGEVIRTKEGVLSYAPPKMDDDEDDEEQEGAAPSGIVAPAGAGAKTAPAEAAPQAPAK